MTWNVSMKAFTAGAISIVLGVVSVWGGYPDLGWKLIGIGAVLDALPIVPPIVAALT